MIDKICDISIWNCKKVNLPAVKWWLISLQTGHQFVFCVLLKVSQMPLAIFCVFKFVEVANFRMRTEIFGMLWKWKIPKRLRGSWMTLLKRLRLNSALWTNLISFLCGLETDIRTNAYKIGRSHIFLLLFRKKWKTPMEIICPQVGQISTLREEA